MKTKSLYAPLAGALAFVCQDVSAQGWIFITNQPQSHAVQVGGSATFSVGVASEGPLFYQWQREGTNIPVATRSTLSFTNLSTNDIGSFRVVASNLSLVITSAVATLNVYPSNFVPVLVTLVGEGQAFLTPTGVVSGPTCFAYPSNTSVQLTLINNAGWKEWEVKGTCHPTNETCRETEIFRNLGRQSDFPGPTNRYGRLVTNNIPITADALRSISVTFRPIRPEIISHPRSITNRVGSNVVLSASAHGVLLTYTWMRGFQTVQQGTNASLIFSNAQESDSGQYYVVIENDGGQVTSSEAALFVYTPVTNDHFTNRLSLSGFFIQTHGATVEATREPNEPIHIASGGASLWWTWEAPESGTFIVDTKGSTFDTLLTVYTGTVLSNLTLIASDDQSGGEDTSQLSFTAEAGTHYAIAVDGFEGAKGIAHLTLRPTRPVILPGFTLSSYFEARVLGQPGTSFVVQTSTNLLQWESVETNTLSGTGTGWIYVWEPNPRPRRFFRVEVQ